MVCFLTDGRDEIALEMESDDLLFVGLTAADELDVAAGGQGSMIEVLVFSDVLAGSVG